MQTSTNSTHWSSRWLFVLAVVGVATGLGAVWELPHVISENGGAAFVYAYLLSMLLVILPVLMVEVAIGRQAQVNPLTAISQLITLRKVSRVWAVIGCLALMAGLIILAYISMTGGWSIFYIIKSLSNGFADTPAEMIQGEFGALLANPKQLIIWHSVFILCAISIVSRGIKSGVEIAIRFLVPAIFVLLLAMLAYCYSSMESKEVLEFMFHFESEKFTTDVMVDAFVYALFTSGLAVGVIMMYSAYLPKETGVSSTAITITILNMLVVLGITLVICMLAFNQNTDLVAAPDMIYQALPVIFTETENGIVLASGFFIMVFIATLIAAIGLLEPVIAWSTERFSFERKRVSWCVGGVAWLLGIVVVLSQNIWAFEFDFLGIEKSKGVADMLTIASAHIIVPLGAFLMVVFASKKSTKSFFREEFALSKKLLFKLCRFIIRFVCFLVLGFVLLHLMFGGLFTYDECTVTFQFGDLTIRFELCNH